jgi:hypothetical protein
MVGVYADQQLESASEDRTRLLLERDEFALSNAALAVSSSGKGLDVDTNLPTQSRERNVS